MRSGATNTCMASLSQERPGLRMSQSLPDSVHESNGIACSSIFSGPSKWQASKHLRPQRQILQTQVLFEKLGTAQTVPSQDGLACIDSRQPSSMPQGIALRASALRSSACESCTSFSCRLKLRTCGQSIR